MLYQKYLIAILFLSILMSGCKKFLSIAPPIDTITTEEIFQNNAQAEWAIAGAYTKLIHGTDPDRIRFAALSSFGAGYSTIVGGLSSDELMANSTLAELMPLSQNKLTLLKEAGTAAIWNSAYKLVYDANAVIEGIAESKSLQLTDSVRKQITGEALVLRAFGYFYLVNFFGDLPLALNIDINAIQALHRSPANKVYEQIIVDLIQAKSLLNDHFKSWNNEKVRINKWFAESLLARVYLFAGRYQDAIQSATAVIRQPQLFSIEQDLTKVFLKNSKEAIFQLKPITSDRNLRNATPEGYYFNQTSVSGDVSFTFTDSFLQSFESEDKRKNTWINSKSSGYFYPYKYRQGPNAATQTEYYTVMRLAELYLIRSEAALLLSPENKNEAIDDLNILRARAGVELLEYTLSHEEVIEAVAQERRVELFAEWGHRWFDLKRTGKAHDVLSMILHKQPWWGDYQLLYPIPNREIESNNNLKQNPEYNSR